MDAGTVVASRFIIERSAGAGGMGEVFKAHDTLNGTSVALKILRTADDDGRARFLREAAALRRLSHPHIVRLLHEGSLPSGESYLAMEWLSGIDLSQRLRLGTLTVADTVGLGSRVASALAEAHAQGVIHRDLKPSNVVLERQNPTAPKVVDFGIASLVDATTLTATGKVLGTPAYMAPEQASGESAVGPQSDLFSLGCILYACLVGTSPFAAATVPATLSRVLFADIPLVSEKLPDVPEWLDQLIDELLRRDPERRPQTASIVSARLAEVNVTEPARAIPLPTRVTLGPERRFLATLFGPPLRVQVIETMTQSNEPLSSAAYRTVAEHGGRLILLADGSFGAVFPADGPPRDGLARAARCSLALASVLPDRILVVGLGRHAIAAELDPDFVESAAQLVNGPESGVVVPPSIAPLLADRFELGTDTRGRTTIVCEHADPTSRSHTSTSSSPFVGRDRELDVLLGTMADVAKTRRARAVLVVAGPGVGKSRLASELRIRLQAQYVEARVWTGGLDQIQAGSPYGVLKAALTDGLALRKYESREQRALVLRSAIEPHLSPGSDSVQFVSELLDLPKTLPESSRFRQAKRDAIAMADSTRQALLEILEGLARTAPLVLILEDLHWGDAPTIGMLDGLLRRASRQPVLVIALARPEIDSVFPSLWTGRPVDRLSLHELPIEASCALASSLLGANADTQLVERIADDSRGNPLLLGELVRHALSSDGDHLRSLEALFQARMSKLSESARQVLRLSSLLGEVFWAECIAALLERDATHELDELFDEEWIGAGVTNRFAGRREFRFRHALARQAAYGTLNGEDLRRGHAAVAAWLEEAGEPSELVLAQHWKLGGHAARAMHWFGLAARRSLASNDLKQAIEHADAAMSTPAPSYETARLLVLEAEAQNWLGENMVAADNAERALELLDLQDPAWAQALHELAFATYANAGDRLAKLLLHFDRLPALSWSVVPSVSAMILCQAQLGRNEEAAKWLVRIQALAPPEDADTGQAWISVAAARLAHARGDQSAAAQYCHESVLHFERAGAVRNATLERTNLSYMLCVLGRNIDAVSEASRCVRDAETLGLATVIVGARINLSLALLQLGRYSEAEQALLEIDQSCGPHLAAWKAIGLARARLGLGRSKDAETELRAVIADATGLQDTYAPARALLVRCLLYQGDVAGASKAAREAEEALANHPQSAEHEVLVRVSIAMALSANGEEDAARAVIQKGLRALTLKMQFLSAPDSQTALLSGVPEHVELLTLAQKYQVPASGSPYDDA